MRSFLIAIVFLGVGATLPARADIIFTNLVAADPPYAQNIADSINGKNSEFTPYRELAMSFTVSGASAFHFDSIEAAWGFIEGTKGPLHVTLYSDNQGVPATVLESINVDSSLIPPGQFGNRPLTTVLSTLHPTLAPGNRYWIGAAVDFQSDTAINWNYSLLGDQGGGLWRLGSPTDPWEPRGPKALQVNGTPLAPVVPEPGSFALSLWVLCVVFPSACLLSRQKGDRHVY